jgi:hypothetical protein
VERTIVGCMGLSISLVCGSRHFSCRRADSAGLPRQAGDGYMLQGRQYGLRRAAVCVGCVSEVCQSEGRREGIARHCRARFREEKR